MTDLTENLDPLQKLLLPEEGENGVKLIVDPYSNKVYRVAVDMEYMSLCIEEINCATLKIIDCRLRTFTKQDNQLLYIEWYNEQDYVLFGGTLMTYIELLVDKVIRLAAFQ